MKKIGFASGLAAILCMTTLLVAEERTVDKSFVAAPRTAYTNQKNQASKNKLPANVGRDIRDRHHENGMVILNNGKFADDANNLVFELQIANLKRIVFRSCAGAPSLAWVTYDANGNVCRIGPQAKVSSTGEIDYKEMVKYDITFEPQEKILCFAVGKAVRGKMRIRYYTEAVSAVPVETAK